jgi:hypothetical protein
MQEVQKLKTREDQFQHKNVQKAAAGKNDLNQSQVREQLWRFSNHLLLEGLPQGQD